MNKQELAREYADCKQWRNSNPEFVKGKENEYTYDCQFCDSKCEYTAYIAGFDKALELIEAYIQDDNNASTVAGKVAYFTSGNLLQKLKELKGEL